MTSKDAHGDVLGGDQTALPRKRSRWRVAVLLVAVLVVLPAGAYLCWYVATANELKAAVESYRAAGEPIDLEDFDVPPVAEAENAAIPLRKAAAAIPRFNSSEVNLCQQSRYLPADAERLRPILEANAEVLRLARQASARPKADWGWRLRDLVANPPSTNWIADFNSQRGLVKFLRAAACFQHLEGDDAEAVETLRDALHVERAVWQSPTLLSDLVAIAIDAIACRAVEQIAPGLAVEGGTGAVESGTARPASRAKVKALMAELLNDKAFSERMRLAYLGQRAQMRRHAETGPAGAMLQAGWRSAMGTVLTPWWRSYCLRRMRQYTVAARSVGRLDWPALTNEIASVGSWDTGRVSDFLFRTGKESALERTSQLNYRALAERRMAGLALAIRLYELDHGGRPPELTRLVPEYVPALPADPFASGGKTFGYLPLAARPLLYSVDLNGLDEGGRYADQPDQVPGSWEYDQPFFLNGDRPSSEPPATGPGAAGPTTAPGAPSPFPAPAATQN